MPDFDIILKEIIDEPKAIEMLENLLQKQAQIEEQNLILMDALATTFEEVLALRAIVEGGTVS